MVQQLAHRNEWHDRDSLKVETLKKMVAYGTCAALSADAATGGNRDVT
jgi:hypothetical protein